MPEDGVITSISVCVGADQGQANCNAQLGVWNSSTKALIVASSTYSMAAHNRTTSGWSFTTQTVASTFIANGTPLWIGFWRDAAGTCVFPVTNAGTFVGEFRSGSGASNFSSPAGWGSNNVMGAYATYVKAEGWIWNGSAWVNGLMQVWNGSAWTNPTGLQVWNGSAWINAT